MLDSTMQRIRRGRASVNVKIPQLYVDIIDANLELGKPLQKAGFTGRANFVQRAVMEKLMQAGLLSEADQKKLDDIRRRRRCRY